MSLNKITLTIKTRGFTIVEMLVIVPAIIVVIGIFISAIVGMTGDVLENKGSNTLSYDVQDALNRIQQDVTSSGAFLAKNNITLPDDSVQGYNDDNTAFENASEDKGNILILNEYATTTNPLSTSRELVYVFNKPNACNSSKVNENTPMMMNVIYFVKNNTLWRRVLAPSNYATLGCNDPFQQPSCAPGVTDPTYNMCVAEDTKVIDDIEVNDFSIAYYPNPGSDTVDETAANSDKSSVDRQTALSANNTVKVTISVTRNIAGRDVTQSGSIRAVSPNNNSSVTFPDCPSGFIVIPGSNTYGTSDFCVMKYEAKKYSSNTPYSVPEGAPWTNLSQTDAINYSQNVEGCDGCHLITEAEWLTIAENVVKQDTNWDSGVAYSGHVYIGASNAHGCNLRADTNIPESDFFANEINSPTTINRRILYLSTGSLIWDFVGNAWEWTSGQTSGGQPGILGGGDGTREYNAVTTHGILVPDPFPSYTGITGSGSWTGATNYIGKIISNADSTSLVAFMRGASCGEVNADAGIYSLQSIYDPTSTFGTVGFRVAR